ncbi:MAG: hypothetical protein ABSG36_07320 [Acidimicrobiales bacterium]
MRKPLIASWSVLVVLGTISLSFIASTRTALAASGRSEASMGKQIAELKGSDTVAGDGFGAPVAISGKIAIVGAWQHAKGGRAYVFAEHHGTWGQIAELKGSDTVAPDDFGSSVAIAANTAIIGAPGRARGGGRAYLFAETKGTWKQVAELKGSDTHDGVACQGDLCPGGSFFGTSVAISNETALVGATNQAKEAGRVYVFTETKGRWRQTAELKGSGTALGGQFGASVAISGSTAAIGASGDLSGGGRVYVFSKTKQTWRQTAKLSGSDTAGSDYFGSAVAVSGTTIVAGAYAHAKLSGRAYIFTMAKGRWRQIAELGSNATIFGGLFGASVAVSGPIVVVGANFRAKNAGRAYVFTRTRGVWSLAGALVGSDTASGDSFGCSVSVSGTTVAVGAFRHAKGAGSAYLFEA